MRNLNTNEIANVSGGTAAEDGKAIAGSIGSFIDGITGIFGIKLNLEKILGSVGEFFGSIADKTKAGK